MTIFDVILIILLGGFILSGIWFGFVHAFGSLVGVVVGALVASHFYESFGAVIESIFDLDSMSDVIAFIILFIVFNRLVGFVFWTVDHVFKLATVLPFLKSVDRLLGAIFGFLEGILGLGLLLYFLGRYPINSGFDLWLSGSGVAHYFVKVAKILEPLLPELLKQLQSVI